MSTGHKKLETNISLMAVFIIIAISLGGLVEIVPLIFLDQVRKPPRVSYLIRLWNSPVAMCMCKKVATTVTHR